MLWSAVERNRQIRVYAVAIHFNPLLQERSLAQNYPIVCTSDELTSARSARTSLIEGARKVKISIDGDVTEYTQITLPQLNDTIAGMQAYQNSTGDTAIHGYLITGGKGF